MSTKHDWFTDTLHAQDAPSPTALTDLLAAIEDDDREVFAIMAMSWAMIVVSRRAREAEPATPAPGSTRAGEGEVALKPAARQTPALSKPVGGSK